MKDPHEWAQLPRSGSKLITSEVELMKHELGLLIPQFAEKIVAPKMTGVDDFLVLVLIGKQMFVYAIFGFQIVLGIAFPLPSLVYGPRMLG